MKKSVVLTIIAIVVVGMIAGFKIFVTAPQEAMDRTMAESKALADMETASSGKVESLVKEIKAGTLSQADFQVEFKKSMKIILDNLAELKDGQGEYLKVAYNGEIFRQIAGTILSKESYKKAEQTLRKDNLGIFSNAVVSYCFDIYDKTDEKADHLKLIEHADKIEGNLDQEIERFTKRVYRWYAGK